MFHALQLQNLGISSSCCFCSTEIVWCSMNTWCRETILDHKSPYQVQSFPLATGKHKTHGCVELHPYGASDFFFFFLSLGVQPWWTCQWRITFWLPHRITEHFFWQYLPIFFFFFSLKVSGSTRKFPVEPKISLWALCCYGMNFSKQYISFSKKGSLGQLTERQAVSSAKRFSGGPFQQLGSM